MRYCLTGIFIFFLSGFPAMSRSESPSLDELLTLLAVADEGTEQAAAVVLGVKQPVVSRRLRVFRHAPALIRLHKGRVELTDRGREVLPAIRRFVEQHRHLKQYLARRRTEGSMLTIGAGASASQFYLARALAEVRQQRPDWEIQTRVLRGKDRIAGVVEGTLDAALVTHSPLQIEAIARWACTSRAELQIDHLADLPLCVIASRDSPLAQTLQHVLAGQIVPVELLADLPLAGLDRESGIRRQLEALLPGSGRRLEFRVEAGGWLGIKEFVRCGLCAGLMPLGLLSPDDAKQFVIRRLPPLLAVTHRMIYRRGTQPEILDDVKAALREAATAFQQQTERRWQGML
jgi:DNA-binding transcriptional LysR family regulator